jgi:transposase InsO family protein
VTCAARIAGGARGAWFSSLPSAVTRISPGRRVYRVLVRHGLLEPVPRRRRRDQYRRWERSVAMELWQMDVTASLFLADGREYKIITGIDDHSRFCVIATVVLRATARAVCSAFVSAMAEYGIPEEVLSDNGKQFTGRFGRPARRRCCSSGSAGRTASPSG